MASDILDPLRADPVREDVPDDRPLDEQLADAHEELRKAQMKGQQ